MRDLLKFLLIGAVIFYTNVVNAAEQYKVLVLPDNIVTDTVAIDSYIYNAASEFFANEVINILNQTDYITCPTVSDERQMLKSDPAYMIPARNLTNKFKTTYNIDYPQLKKIALKNKSRYVLMMTTTLDAENYVLRRTLWDFLNIAGASVIDPAYKVNTYAALVDTTNNIVLWSNTFYKTISTVEARILTRGPSPQTEQLQKLRDYSRMLCPEIAENVQVNVLSPAEYEKETCKVYYDMANFDNIFTKKYRRWNKEGKKDWNALSANTKKKKNDFKERQAQKRAERNAAKEANKVKTEQTIIQEVKAEEYKTESVKSKTDNSAKIVQPLDFEDQSLFEPFFLRRHRKNTLIENTDPLRPPLRDYDRL